MINIDWTQNYLEQRDEIEEITTLLKSLSRKQKPITIQSLTEPTPAEMEDRWHDVVGDLSHSELYTKFFWVNPSTFDVEKIFTNIDVSVSTLNIELAPEVASDWEYITSVMVQNDATLAEPLVLTVPSTYNHLFISYSVKGNVAGAGKDLILVRPNNLATAIYYFVARALTSAAEAITQTLATTSGRAGNTTGAGSDKWLCGSGFMFFPHYKDTTWTKNWMTMQVNANGSPVVAANREAHLSYNTANLTSAIATISLLVNTGTLFVDGTIVHVWGLN